ncbi:hypothetical protein B0T11DRAFT_343205 [Plectosphaerella cucumerina]|uniref:Uncharacterized protein n=1 Tax=Plectosphaerella cucumerina TaxID=40658 RepID=A0A8K0T7Y1_9PEZI|nr:hypothetical protein B0T11DRAFT_343205 [Plectosphaerella cucumerina]
MKVFAPLVCLFAVAAANATTPGAPIPGAGAVPVPPPVAANPAAGNTTAAPPAAAPGAVPGTVPGQGAPLPSAADTPQCASAKILAQSIGVNILIQMQEQIRTTQVMMTLMTNPVNPQQFEAAKANLLSAVNDGIGLREANQLITPAGNPATEGIAVVANAQLTELRKSSSLTGNPATDMPVLQSLQQDFAGGIMQNQKNQQAALAGCP